MGKAPPSLEQLLRRPDLWRGHSHRFTKEKGIDSGYPNLNQALQHEGWPNASLIEVCQAFHACEWWLFSPAIQTVLGAQAGGSIALINPPAMPFIQGLQKIGIDTRRLLIIDTKTPQDFVYSFTEVSQSPACPIIFAWQAQYTLPYTQLRKLQLCALEHYGLSVIFRHERVMSQSSPASLRLVLTPTEQYIHLNIVKQPGKLRHTHIKLPIPDVWKALPTHSGNTTATDTPYSRENNNHDSVAIFPKITSRNLKTEVKRGYH